MSTENTIAAKFMRLFDGLPRAYGVFYIKGAPAARTGKFEGEAETLQRPVDATLWERHLRGEIQLGIVPLRDDATCMFGAIDIDDYKTDHIALEKAIVRLKLPLVIVRSKSGGAHLYAFFKEPAPAKFVRERLADWAAALGHANVEIFPKQDRLLSSADTGNWINMPYSGGDESTRHALLKGQRLTQEQFLQHAESVKKKFQEAPKLANEEAPELLEDGPPCLIKIAVEGAPEGTRNTTMFNYGVYCKKRWPDDWKDRVSEHNTRYINPPLSDKELLDIVVHLDRKDYAYTCKDKALSPHCNKNACLKRKYGLGPESAQEYFGIDIKNVLRVEYAVPVYYADFNGRRMKFTAEDLNSQMQFRKLLIEQVNDSFMPLPNARWAQFIIQLCNSAEVAEAPPETRGNAEVIGWLEDYCIEQLPARGLEDVLDGLVYEDKGRMYFLPRKWVGWVSREIRRRMSLDEAYRALQSAGVQSESIVIKRRRYTLWSVPRFERPEHERKAAGEEM